MPVEKFIQHLQTIGTLDEKDIEKIHLYFKAKNCKKNEVLVPKNKVCDKLYFVVKGTVRAFYTNKKGIETTRLISIENQFCTNWASFNDLSENNETIQSIENSLVLWIGHQDFYHFISQSEKVKNIYIKTLEYFQSYHIKRIEFLSSFSNKEKIEKFNQYYPKVSARISNKILASFLSISPEHCSKIKAELLENNRNVNNY
jgi:signal-transduction protein with cAMP-binding, CBS, and nucleotidyltransferase domain